jgi:hypothetical protein
VQLKLAVTGTKDACDGLGCWFWVKNYMFNFAMMAVENADIELLHQLDHEYEQIRDDCMSTTD